MHVERKIKGGLFLEGLNSASDRFSVLTLSIMVLIVRNIVKVMIPHLMCDKQAIGTAGYNNFLNEVKE